MMAEKAPGRSSVKKPAKAEPRQLQLPLDLNPKKKEGTDPPR